MLKKIDMEANRDLIIILIQADLKYSQLVSSLTSIDLHTDSYFLQLHKTISALMDLCDETPDQRFEIYDLYLKDSQLKPISGSPKSLLPLAEECYDLLYASIKIENHLNLKG